ncbi:DUF3383 family protein [Lachnospiraceae bacterium 38-14]
MKNNSLDDIVKCNIEISNPASNDATFDSILLVVKGPDASGEKTMSRTTAIAQADELLDYGFTTDDAAYIAATVAFSQNPAPSSIYICIRQEISEEGAEDAEAVVAYEDIRTTLARANGEVSFYGIHLTEFGDEADIQEAISWTEANEKIFGFEYTDIEKCPVKNFSFYRSFGMFSGKADGYDTGEQPIENEYAALAWMAKCFGYDPGTETWNMKELASIVPSALSTDEKKLLEENGINSFRRYAGSNITFGGNMLSGEWIDVIRFRDWLKAEMQTNVFNALKTNRKVPFTDGGIGLIEGQMESTLSKGQTIGGIAPTEYDSEDYEIPGYTVTVPLASDLTEAERKSRKLTGCRYTARLAGAIHIVEIHGNLTF